MSRLLTEADLIGWIKRRLGAPLLNVPLDDDKLQDGINEAKHWFIARKGMNKQMTITLADGQVEYDMPIECDAVIDVSFDASAIDIAGLFQPNFNSEEQVPYNVFAPPAAASGGLYSSLVQAMQYNEMAKTITSSERKWLWIPERKVLLILPARSGHAIIEYKLNSIPAIELMYERDHDLIKRYSLAHAKRDLGYVFSRYASWPTAQGQSVLNGPQLLKDAEDEFKLLEEEVASSAMPMPFLIG